MLGLHWCQRFIAIGFYLLVRTNGIPVSVLSLRASPTAMAETRARVAVAIVFTTAAVPVVSSATTTADLSTHAFESLTRSFGFEFAGNGYPEPHMTNRRCGIDWGGRDMVSAMCRGATTDGRLVIQLNEIAERCSIDPRCVGFGWEFRRQYFRPISLFTGIGVPGRNHWRTFVKRFADDKQSSAAATTSMTKVTMTNVTVGPTQVTAAVTATVQSPRHRTTLPGITNDIRSSSHGQNHVFSSSKRYAPGFLFGSELPLQSNRAHSDSCLPEPVCAAVQVQASTIPSSIDVRHTVSTSLLLCPHQCRILSAQGIETAHCDTQTKCDELYVRLVQLCVRSRCPSDATARSTIQNSGNTVDSWTILNMTNITMNDFDMSSTTQSGWGGAIREAVLLAAVSVCSRTTLNQPSIINLV